MPRNILIGTLGERPGVVTCTLDCFWEKHNIQFDEIILVTTNKTTVTRGYKQLDKHLTGGDCPICKRYAGLKICLDTVNVPEILTEADNNEILSKILGHLRRESRPDTDIYLSLSGGLKHMSAILTFAGMLFPVSGLYHVTPRDERILERAEEERDRKVKQGDDISPELTWHYSVKKDFHIVRLPFIGLTPFFEALAQFVHFQHASQIEDKKIHEWFTTMEKDPNFEPSIRYLSKVLGSPIDQLTATGILKLQRFDYSFWHDCIKRGSRSQRGTPPFLWERWRTYKTLFTTQKVSDPIFDDFDSLFEQSIEWSELCRRFEAIYFEQLNPKIIRTLRARSINIVDLIKNAGRDALARWKREGGKGKQLKFNAKQIENQTSPVQICVDEHFSVMLYELIHNAIKFAEAMIEIEVTLSHIVIRNDGDPFQQTLWEKKPKSKLYPEQCSQHLLKFEIGDGSAGSGTEVKIKGYDIHRAAVDLPINALHIRDAKEYK